MQVSSTNSHYWSELTTKIIFSIINMCNSRVKMKKKRDRKENVDKTTITWMQKPTRYLGAQGCYQYQFLVQKALINIHLIELPIHFRE